MRVSLIVCRVCGDQIVGSFLFSDAARLTASSIYDVFQWDSPPERSTLMSPVDVTPSIPPLADAATTKVSGESTFG